MLLSKLLFPPLPDRFRVLRVMAAGVKPQAPAKASLLRELYPSASRFQLPSIEADSFGCVHIRGDSFNLSRMTLYARALLARGDNSVCGRSD